MNNLLAQLATYGIGDIKLLGGVKLRSMIELLFNNISTVKVTSWPH